VIRRLAPAALLALGAAVSCACAGSTPAPKEPARPVAPAAPPAPEVTSDRGDRVLAPSPVGRLAPEDAPVAPGPRR
jgi:hypothetical protein